MPTDTIFGIVGTALDEKTVERIYAVRGRNPNKPLIVLISSLDELKQFDVDITDDVKETLESVWPGEVTVILPIQENALLKWKYLHRDTGKIAFRLPRKEDLLQILKETGPLTAPSANLEGFPPAKNISEAKEYFKDMVDFYMEGESGGEISSTIIEYDGKDFTLIREGAVSADLLRSKKVLK